LGGGYTRRSGGLRMVRLYEIRWEGSREGLEESLRTEARGGGVEIVPRAENTQTLLE
jgi:hypothetical protein